MKKFFNILCLVIILGIVFSKVFSPQYMIWLFPFIFLIELEENRKKLLWVLICSVFLLTTLIFPYYYGEVVGRLIERGSNIKNGATWFGITLLTLRNGGLIFIATLIVKTFLKNPHTAKESQ